MAIERLAREGHLPFPRLWDVVRQERPVARARFKVQDELLQILGDAILRETYRARQYEETAASLEDAPNPTGAARGRRTS